MTIAMTIATTIRREAAPIVRTFRALRADTRGLAAVEFALVAPLLLALLLSGVTLFDMFRFEERTESTTYTIADLVSRQDLVDLASLQTLHATHVALVGQPANMTRTRITSVIHKATKRDKDGTVIESELVPEWTFENGVNNKCKAATVAELPMDKIPEIAVADSVLIVETASEKPLLTNRISGLVKTNFSDVAIVRPRYTASILLRSC